MKRKHESGKWCVRLDGVGKICYLGNMLGGCGGANSTSVILTRVYCARGMFRELSGILTRMDVSFKLKGKVYVTCVRSAVVCWSETWAMSAEQIRLFRNGMVQWMCSVSLWDEVPSVELRDRMRIELITDVM